MEIFVSKKILGHIVFHSTTYIPFFSHIFKPLFSRIKFSDISSSIFQITRQSTFPSKFEFHYSLRLRSADTAAGAKRCNSCLVRECTRKVFV